MFATILRRWRLVTPLVLAVLAISIVSGGMMMPASAHNIKFHFFGRAYAFDDVQPIPQTACDTGYLPLTGQNDLDSGHCFGAGGPGQPGQGTTGTETLYSIYADSSVVSTHGNTKGKVVATSDLEGSQDVCLSIGDCAFNSSNPFVTPVTTIVATATPKAQENGTTCPVGFSAVTDAKGNITCILTSTACAEGVVNGSSCITNNLGETTNCPGFAPVTLVFCSGTIIIQGVASCHRRSDGSTQASVAAAITKFVNPAVVEDNRIEFIGDSNGEGAPAFGLPNESFTLNNGFTFDKQTVDILVTINEQIPFVDGDLGAISANAVHIIVTSSFDIVLADFIIGHVFAGIHCAKSLGTDQNIGTLVSG